MKTIIHVILIIIGMIIYNLLFDIRLFCIGIPQWMMIIGILLFMTSIMLFWLIGWKTVGINIVIAFFLTAIGSCLSLNEPATPGGKHDYQYIYSATDDQIGECPKSEWQLVIKYNYLGLNNSDNSVTFIGSTSEANSALTALTEKWKKNNPKKIFLSSEKVLCYVPLSYLKEHHYPLTLGERY